MYFDIVIRIKLIFLFVIIACLYGQAGTAYADQAEVCGVPLAIDQIDQIDDSNLKVVVFGETHLISSKSLPEFLLQAYLKNKPAAAEAGADKWKTIFEECIGSGRSSPAARAFILYAIVAGEKNTVNTDFIESVFLNSDKDYENTLQKITLNPGFSKLSGEIKNIIFLALGIADIHWLRVNLLGKSFYLSEEFQAYSESMLSGALNVKNVGLARKISLMLENLYIANAEKYKKYTLACNLIEELVLNKVDLTSSRILALVSIRNTDQALRGVLDPFIIEAFHALASNALEAGKYDEALSSVSSINIEQATPTTYELIKKIIPLISPESGIFLNEKVRQLLLSAAQNDTQLKLLLAEFYYSRVIKLLDRYNISHALADVEVFRQLSGDLKKIKRLEFTAAQKYLQAGYREKAAEILSNTKISFFDRVRLFIDGYYGNPLFYILIILIPLLIKLMYEFFYRITHPFANVNQPAAEKTSVNADHQKGREQAEYDQAGHDQTGHASNFVKTRSPSQQNQLVEEYSDCLSIFELEKGVDLKTIKTAYRNAVRKIHPDLNQENQSAEDASRFVELTRTYDRLRELHKLLGLKEK